MLLRGWRSIGFYRIVPTLGICGGDGEKFLMSPRRAQAT